MGLVGQIPVEGPDGGDLPGPGGGVEAVVRVGAVVVLGPVPAQVGHIAVDVRQRDAGHEVQIHVQDVDLIQGPAGKAGVPDLFHVAEEIPQVQEVFVHGAPGVGLDGLMVREKVPQDLRRLGAVIGHNNVGNRKQTRWKTVR